MTGRDAKMMLELAERIETPRVDSKFDTRLIALSDKERDLLSELLRATAAPSLPTQPALEEVITAKQFWEALKIQCGTTPDKSKIKALVMVRFEDVVAALAQSPKAQEGGR